MVDSVTLALNEPSAANLLDDAGQATGSLLGSLVIVARFRGVQLSKEQLIRDHQLKTGDASVKETLSIARASGLRAARRGCGGAICSIWARRGRQSCCCATARRWF